MNRVRQVAWITGAGKGIGRALALRLAQRGWTVAASARTRSDLDALAQEAPDGAIHPFILDVTDPAATQAAVAAIEDSLGAIDLAVLNAGIYIPTGVQPFNARLFRDQFDINVMGTVNGLAALVPLFTARRRGHIAVMASVAGYRGLPSAAAYGATKAALINMCEALKIELEPHGVAVSVICPGFVRTPLTDKNTFPMPFIITAQDAAEHIERGLTARRFEIAFPPLFAWMMKILRILPDRVFFALARRMRRH
jgi:NAD(P)-dependent dehydrogenase (short-subunit alcohol dehydrogenase family)